MVKTAAAETCAGHDRCAQRTEETIKTAERKERRSCEGVTD